jgi:hypothetical protein
MWSVRRINTQEYPDAKNTHTHTHTLTYEEYAGARGVCGSIDTQEHADATCSARGAGGGIIKKQEKCPLSKGTR